MASTFDKIEDSLSFIKSLERSINDFNTTFDTTESGIIVSVFDGIVKIEGLDKVKLMEIIKFENGGIGMAIGLNFDSVDVVMLANTSQVKEGQKVFRTKTLMSVKVGPELLGRVVDATGNPIDGKGEIASTLFSKIEVESPGILDRKSVDTPLETGILMIDANIPIGRGQRELIIGDRQTGKTTIAFDTMINQCKLNNNREKSQKMYSIYVAIGLKRATVAKMIQELEEKNLMKDCIFVVASASDSATEQFIAPYAACAIAEYFRNNGMHALIVYDDLSKHAVAYREISLLLKRPPSREAYPADIFYLHSRLLERSANMSDDKGGGSLTCLPIIETQAGDISGYIPTNVVSITDGQIFLEPNLFYQGIRPAINIGISVSRIGSAAQCKGVKSIAGKLKNNLSQYRELESFAKFGSDLDKVTRTILDNGKKIIRFLIQKNCSEYSTNEQIVILYIIVNSYLLEQIDLSKIPELILTIKDFASKNDNILTNIQKNGFKECDKEFAHLIQVLIQNYKV